MGKHSSSGGGLFGGSGGSKGRRKPPGGVRPEKPHTHHAAGKRVLPRAARRGPDDAEQVVLSDPRARRTGALEKAPARLRVERDRRRSRTKRIVAVSALAVLGLIVLGAIGGFAYVKHIESTMRPDVKPGIQAALKKAEPQKPYTVLLLGDDHRWGEKRFRTDTIILAKIDPKTKHVWLLSIPRDMRVDIPGHGARKINEAFYWGGPELAIKTVESFTGVPINHYAQVNFRGFWETVDAMGGVWIDVPTEINDRKAASHSPDRRAFHIDAGYQLLDGEHALTFVRSRDFADADFSRMKNQQLFFKALADQVSKKQNLARLPRIVSAVAPYIKTDMSLMEMVRTAQALKNAGGDRVYTASITGDWRSPFVWPDEEKKAELIDAFTHGRSFEPTPAAGTTGTAEPTSTTSKSADDEPATLRPQDITVAIRNGAGIVGCAKQASSILKARSFKVGDVGNANQFVYPNTLVVYKKDKNAAEQVASVLPPGTKLVESRGMYAYDGEVLVVIGKDWDVSRVPVTPVKTQ